MKRAAMMLVLSILAFSGWSQTPVQTGTLVAESELSKATRKVQEVVAARAAVDMAIRAEQARHESAREFYYKVATTIGALLLLLWLFPRVSSLTIPSPFGTGSIIVTKVPVTPPPAPVAGTAAKAANVAAPNAPKLSPWEEAGVPSDSIYLSHTIVAGRVRPPLVEVFLDADRRTALDRVARVEYHFPNAVMDGPVAINDRTARFAMRFPATAEFMLYAFVYFHDVAEPVRLRRYLNLAPPPR